MMMIETKKNLADSATTDVAVVDNNTSSDFFPRQLYHMLEDAELKGFDNIISWVGDNNSIGFKLHSKQKFESYVLSHYFKKQTKTKSFLRQLNLWGFHRVTGGQYKGVYTHKTFCKGISMKECLQIRRPKRDTYTGSIILSTSSTREEEETKKFDSDQQGITRRNVVSPVSSEGDLKQAMKNIKKKERPAVDVVKQQPLLLKASSSSSSSLSSSSINSNRSSNGFLLKSKMCPISTSTVLQQELSFAGSSSSSFINQESSSCNFDDRSSSSSTTTTSTVTDDHDLQEFIQFGNFGFFPPDVTTTTMTYYCGSY